MFSIFSHVWKSGFKDYWAILGINKMSITRSIIGLVLSFNASGLCADTIFTSPTKSYQIVNSEVIMESLQGVINNTNTAFTQWFGDCMIEAEEDTFDDYWACDNFTIVDHRPHPILNKEFINGEPTRYELLVSHHVDNSNVYGHDVYDEDGSSAGAIVRWDCPDNYNKFNIKTGENSKELICIQIKPQVCEKAGNPINLGTCEKNELETDYKSQNGNLTLKRRYLDQYSGWVSDLEPKLRHVVSGGEVSSAGVYPGVNGSGCNEQTVQSFKRYRPEPGNPFAIEEYKLTNCIGLIPGDSVSEAIYLYKDGYQYRFLEDNGIFYREGGYDKDVTIRAYSDPDLPNAVWVLRSDRGYVEYFDSHGNLIKRDYENGSSITYQYDGEHLISKGDQYGRTIHYHYDLDGDRLLSVTLPGDVTIQYEYLNDTNPDEPDYWLLESVHWSNGESISYTYNEQDHITGESYPTFLTGKYDGYGERIGTYEYLNGDAVSTQGFQGTNYRSIAKSTTSTTVNDSYNNTSIYEYAKVLSNGKKLLTKLTHKTQDGTIYRTKRYNVDGQVIESRDYKGNKTQYGYDESTKLRTVVVTGISSTQWGVFTQDSVALPSGVANPLRSGITIYAKSSESLNRVR